MIKEKLIEEAYRTASEKYAATGVDTENALERLGKLSLSLHCWQADDVGGFENRGGELGGGIQVTGNYPGKARNIDELRDDIETVAKLIPGKHRLNLHAIYGDFGGKKIDRNEIEPEHFLSWQQWAGEQDMKLDFNSTSFSHPKSGNFTLSSFDESIRRFWIEHTERCRRIADTIGAAQNDPCLMNIWIHDGSKETPANRLRHRKHLAESLDEIFGTNYENMKDCLEPKLFGIGLESFTVGSYDFYLAYANSRKKIVTLDTGHFHPTESIADKISSLLPFMPEIMLHVSRPVRWDSDHVVILNDDLLDLAREIVRSDAMDRVHVGLDYFDGTINRIGAYVTGSRATQKAFLAALLEPRKLVAEYEENGMLFERLAILEECKSLPLGAVWDMFCLRTGVEIGENYIRAVRAYYESVAGKRN